jgi:protocadherin Fat 1/2/3
MTTHLLSSIDVTEVQSSAAILTCLTHPTIFFIFLNLTNHALNLFQVFVAVENENDNTPLTVEPVYYPSVPENSPAGKVVVELKAEDYDLDPAQRLTFRITAGNPGGFFSINPDTGKKKTIVRILFVFAANGRVQRKKE